MSEEESWRSESAYDYIDTLTTSELAWEFLRRNPDYRSAFQALRSSGRWSDEIATAFAQQWGLCFRGRPRHHWARAADLLDSANRSVHDHHAKRSCSARRSPSHP
ncbi:transcriptional regulator domain-containing protein [Rhizobium pisi]|uniref:transcriptional regulator domain-containing protein n=1 Tax=Rhizobium pisi TaxID=574561 RepID=UPI003D045F30